MKRFLGFFMVAMLVALLGTFAFGDDSLPIVNVGVKFNDSSFDYYVNSTSDTEIGYIHLVRDLNTLTVVLDDVAEGGLKISFDEIKEPEDDTEISASDLRTKVGVDVGTWSVHLTFKDTELEQAQNYFLDVLKGLNFKPVEVVSTSNTIAFDCGCNVDATYHLRVVFTRLGADVFVNISSL